MSTPTWYLRTGPMTQNKLEWIQRQIDSLEEANRELVSRVNRDTVNVSVNQMQITAFKKLLRETEV